MKVAIYKDEWWPVYVCSTEEFDLKFYTKHGSYDERVIEMPDELYAAYQNLYTLWEELQEQIAKMVEEKEDEHP
jgi:hypothetical protein